MDSTGEKSILRSRVLVHDEDLALTPGIAEVYEAIGVHSLLVAVLRVRGESLGTLSLFRFDPAAPSFDRRDQEVAQALADHAALAITNARLLQSTLRELAVLSHVDCQVRQETAAFVLV